MKKLLLSLIATLLTLAASAETIYSIDFSKSQTGWQCVDYTGKQWKFMTNAYYDNGNYYSAVTMERNYSGSASFAKYMYMTGIQLAPGTYKVRTLALKEGGSPSVTLSFFPLSAKTEDEVTRIATLNLGTHYTEEAIETHTIVVNKEEKYYFTFDGETQPGDYHSPFLFRFEILTDDGGESGGESGGEGEGGGESGGGESGGGEGGGESSTDLFSDTMMPQWTVIDNNADSHTWAAAGKQWLYNGIVATSGADDYLITPAIDVTAGTDYEVSMSFLQASAFDPDHLEVFFGAEPTLAAMTNGIGSIDVYGTNGSGTAQGKFRLSAGTADKVCIAIHLKGSEPNGSIALTALSLTPVEKGKPQPVTALTATSNPDDKAVLLTWTNPLVDTKGMAIVKPLTINIYENGTLIRSLENRQPGKPDSYVFNPERFEGDVTYSLTALVDGVESEAATQSVNLDDNRGDWILVHSFADVTRDSFTDWYTLNVVGQGAWAFGYGNVIAFNNKLESNEDDWLITPQVSLEPDKRYLVRYELQTQEAFSATIAVTLGREQTPQEQSRTLKSHVRLFQNGFGEFTTPQFTVDEAGTYHIGFHLTATECKVYLRNVEVYEVSTVNTGIDAPLTPAAGTTPTYDLTGRKVNAPTQGIFIRDGKKFATK